MWNELIPPADLQRIFADPWTAGFEANAWMVLMGFLVSSACGLVGKFLILRRMALVGDAISHSVLPGIAVAFLLAQSRATLPMFIGALLAGILTTVLIELIHRKSRVKPDAAIGITFSSLFAIGVILITGFSDHIDLDTDCVLYGEIGLIGPYFTEPFTIGGSYIGPWPVIRMGLLLLMVVGLILAFYKELLVTSFDAALAASLGVPANCFHYGLMVVLSLVIVGSFEAVGAILVIAMLIFPGATASLFSDRLPRILWLVVGLGVVYAVGGLHLSEFLNAAPAPSMVVVAFAVFVLSWLFSPRRGVLTRVASHQLDRWKEARPHRRSAPAATADVS